MKRRPAVDWVVNDNTYGFQLTVPNAGLVALPLTFPQMQLTAEIWAAAQNIGGSAFPEQGRPQHVVAVSGSFHTVPSVWAAGSSFRWIARITKKPMDLNTGDAIADALYSLQDADFANERFAWQKTQFQRYDMGGVGETHQVRAKVNQNLEPDEALYFIFENISGITQTLTLQLFLRTLMRVSRA